jgi:hypothetical protein
VLGDLDLSGSPLAEQEGHLMRSATGCIDRGRGRRGLSAYHYFYGASVNPGPPPPSGRSGSPISSRFHLCLIPTGTASLWVRRVRRRTPRPGLHATRRGGSKGDFASLQDSQPMCTSSSTVARRSEAWSRASDRGRKVSM